MEAIAGMPVTPRRVQGPGFELVGLLGERGHHTAVWYPPSSPGRAEGLALPDGARAFLERPGLPGIARLTHLDRDTGAVVYASGEVWSLAEVVASLRRRGEIPGVRAGVELAWRVATLLAEAQGDAAAVRLAGHGAIDPWRVALRRDGQVYLLGYGMSAGKAALRCGGLQLREALRYAPPERLEGRAEDASSDLFSLALVALEWMVGEPVYRGDEESLRRQAREAEGDRRLYAWRERLPAAVVEVFGRAVRRDVDGRWQEPAAFAEAARRVLAHPALTGPSLFQTMASPSIDPPHRFVGLSEERGEVDNATRTREELVVDHQTEPHAAPRRWRHVALGGRQATRARPVRELSSSLGTLVEALPSRAGTHEPAVSTPLAPMGLQIPRPSGPRTLLPDDADEVQLVGAPPAVDEPFLAEADDAAGGGFGAEDTLNSEEVFADAAAEEEADADELEEDEITSSGPAVEAQPTTVHRRAPVRPATMGPEPTRFSQDEAPTMVETLSKDLVSLALTGPDGHPFRHVFDGGFTVAEAAEELVRERPLAERDLSGQTAWGWRITFADGPCDQRWTVDKLVGREDLLVERVPARMYRVRVRLPLPGAPEVELALSGALRARQVIASLLEMCGLRPRRWRLVIDGVDVAPPRLLDEVLKDGALVELVG
jgi:hypothetical protein